MFSVNAGFFFNRINVFKSLLLLFKILVFTLTNDQEDVGSRMDEGELTKVWTQGIKKKKTQLLQLVTVCWSSGADSGFLAFPSLFSNK